ncbi:MAG: hypothetical protein ABW176_13025 [Candidatus Thiodiazotropha endolucinida]
MNEEQNYDIWTALEQMRQAISYIAKAGIEYAHKIPTEELENPTGENMEIVGLLTKVGEGVRALNYVHDRILINANGYDDSEISTQ